MKPRMNDRSQRSAGSGEHGRGARRCALWNAATWRRFGSPHPGAAKPRSQGSGTKAVRAHRNPKSAAPPTAHRQPPTANNQLPTTNFQLPTTNYQLPTSNFQLLPSPCSPCLCVSQPRPGRRARPRQSATPPPYEGGGVGEGDFEPHGHANGPSPTIVEKMRVKVGGFAGPSAW